MFDELDRPRAEENLRRLLAHYAARAEADRETWQSRVMELDGRSSNELVRLHGELLSHEWIEQNVLRKSREERPKTSRVGLPRTEHAEGLFSSLIHPPLRTAVPQHRRLILCWLRYARFIWPLLSRSCGVFVPHASRLSPRLPRTANPWCGSGHSERTVPAENRT
jgi:hypothetical protein